MNIRFVSMTVHAFLDYRVALSLVAAPFALGLQGMDAWYYWANGTAVLLVTLVLNAPESEDRAMKSMPA